MIEFVLVALLAGIALGYGFRGQIAKLLGSAKSEVSSLSAAAKLEEVKAKTEVVKAAVDARTDVLPTREELAKIVADVVNDVHTAIEDLAKKL